MNDAMIYLFTPRCETEAHTTCSSPFIDAAVITMIFVVIVMVFTLLYSLIRDS